MCVEGRKWGCNQYLGVIPCKVEMGYISHTLDYVGSSLMKVKPYLRCEVLLHQTALYIGNFQQSPILSQCFDPYLHLTAT